MKLTARNDQVMIKSQSKPNFASENMGTGEKLPVEKKVKFEP